MPTLILEGHIELLQPVTFNIPGENPVNPHLHMTPRYDATGTRSLTPYLPGSNIKGAMRSQGGMPALAEIYGADPADESTWGVFTINQVYRAQSGGLVSKAKTTAVDLLRARHNRVLDTHNSLFGAMGLSMKGLLEIGHALPDQAVYAGQSLRGRHHGARRDVYQADPGRLNRHTDAEVDAFVDMKDANKRLSALRSAEKSIDDKIRKATGNGRRKDGDEGASAELKALHEQLQQIKDEKAVLQGEGAESMGRTLAVREYMPVGLRLDHGMRLINASDITIGYFLRVLAHFSNNCRLGALATAGFGDVRMSYGLRVREGLQTREAGTVTIAPYEFDLDVKHPALDRAIKAFEEAAKQPDKFFRLDLGEKPAAKAVEDVAVEADGAAAEPAVVADAAPAAAPAQDKPRRGRPPGVRAGAKA